MIEKNNLNSPAVYDNPQDTGPGTVSVCVQYRHLIPSPADSTSAGA